MKGPNPFAPWNSDPEAICGRKEELKAFTSLANGTASKQAGVMMVVGGPGLGKSEMLRRFRDEAEKAGLLAPFIKAEGNEGLDDIAEKIRADLPANPQAGKEGARPGGIEALVSEVMRAARKSFGAIAFIDDFDRARKPDEALRKIIKTVESGYGKRGISFVLGSTRPFKAESGVLRAVRLKQFGDHEAHELIEKALKKGPPKMGEECLQSILADSGGNPRLFKMACFIIYEKLRDNEKVITKGHYLAYLPQIMGTLSREWFGAMFQEAPPAERAILHALASMEEGAHVSDIAKRIKRPLGPTTALIGRLLSSGQIERVSRGKYRIFSRLYGRYVAQRG